jgi:hypothetical protein
MKVQRSLRSDESHARVSFFRQAGIVSHSLSQFNPSHIPGHLAIPVIPRRSAHFLRFASPKLRAFQLNQLF